MRLFAALRPPSQALDHLQDAVDAVVPPWLGAGPSPLRWTDPLQRHITLAFYGDVPDGATDDIAGALADVAARWQPLELQLAGAGVFSGTTLWAGVHAGDELVSLMAQCDEVGEGISRLEPRDRRRAHLTLARLGRRGPRSAGHRRDRRSSAPSWVEGTVWSGRRGGWSGEGGRRDGDWLEDDGRHGRQRPGRGADRHRGRGRQQAGPARSGRSRDEPGRRGDVDLDAVVHALSVYRGPVWQASQIELVASVLGEGRGGGPRHELVATFPLGTA